MFLLSLLTVWSHPSIFDHYYTNSFSLMASPSSNCQLLSKNGNLDSPTAMPFAEATHFMAMHHQNKRNSDILLQNPSSNQLTFSRDSSDVKISSKIFYIFFLLINSNF